ncbi:hypothetical protein Tco_0139397 [Tanacetum coccineum]
MFRDTLQLPMETPKNPFVALANIHEQSLKKEAIQYPCFIKLIIAELMKKFPNIPKRLKEDYHSIKDDVPLETKKRKQTARESSSRRITIKRKKQSTPSIPPTRDNRERDAIAEATLLSLTLHKTALLTEDQENTAKVQEKLDEEEIDKLVDGDDDDESSASVFADSVLNNDGDDIGSNLESGNPISSPSSLSTESANTLAEDSSSSSPSGFNKDREVSPVDISGMVSKEFAAHGPKLIEELFRKHMQNTTLNLYPKTKSSTATTSSADL